MRLMCGVELILKRQIQILRRTRDRLLPRLPAGQVKLDLQRP